MTEFADFFCKFPSHIKHFEHCNCISIFMRVMRVRHQYFDKGDLAVSKPILLIDFGRPTAYRLP